MVGPPGRAQGPGARRLRDRCRPACKADEALRRRAQGARRARRSAPSPGPTTSASPTRCPRPRSGKIMRRLLRDIAAGKETLGDTTTLEDYSVLAQAAGGRGVGWTSVARLRPGFGVEPRAGFDCLGAAITGKGDVVTVAPLGRGRACASPPSRTRGSPPTRAQHRGGRGVGRAARRRGRGGSSSRSRRGCRSPGGLGGSAASAVAGAVAADALFEPRPLARASCSRPRWRRRRWSPAGTPTTSRPCLWGGAGAGARPRPAGGRTPL